MPFRIRSADSVFPFEYHLLLSVKSWYGDSKVQVIFAFLQLGKQYAAFSIARQTGS